MTAAESPRLASFIEGTLASVRVPGCSIALVGASGVIWSAGFGFADLKERRPACTGTVYHLFSGTKLFTAAAVLQLVEQGRLALEDSVAKHLPEAEAISGVTLHHLLSHRSGLKDTLRGFLMVSFSGEESATSTEALAGYKIAQVRPPGDRVEYRNVNYALLGEIITRVSGLEYREYLRRNLLEPLHMQAGFTVTEAMRPRLATGYIERWDPMRLALRLVLPDVSRRLYGDHIGPLIALHEYNLRSAAVGGLVGSAVDFARFLEMQLTGVGDVLSADSLRRMKTLVAEGAAGVESRMGVGLGWKFGRVGDRVFLNHEGVGAGFTSELRLYPDAELGIALAMNAMRTPRTMRVAHRICEAVYAGM